jgi:DNA primase
LLGFQCVRRRADQWYGYCPRHPSEPKHRRAFSVNVRKGCYYCHKCPSRGDQFTLWTEANNMPLHPATIHLCHQLGLEVPWLSIAVSARTTLADWLLWRLRVKWLDDHQLAVAGSRCR